VLSLSLSVRFACVAVGRLESKATCPGGTNERSLAIIANFWETVIGGSRTYARPKPMKHLPRQLRDEPLERWLFLWQTNCRARLPADAAREMIDLSQHIGAKLRWILGLSSTA
jgi:truncated hemoglobin YjbI